MKVISLLLVFHFVYYVKANDVGVGLYNTTVCFNSVKTAYSLRCGSNVELVVPKNIFYGVKPKAVRCTGTDCCIYNETDCYYQRNDKLKDIWSCAGTAGCDGHIKRQLNGIRCKTYPYFSMYSYIEYECINIQKMINICDDGITKRDTNLYLASNVFHQNTDTTNTTSTCHITTQCNNTIELLAVDVKLTTNPNTTDCYEELQITDSKTGLNKTISCKDGHIFAYEPVFTSDSNIISINLITKNKHSGKVWMQVKGSTQDSEIEVRCGDNIRLEVNEKHLCPEDKKTSATILDLTSNVVTDTTSIKDVHVTPEISTYTTVCDDCIDIEKQNQVDQPGLTAGAMGGIAAAVILIILILIVILVLVFRSRKADPNEHIYDTASDYHETNAYQTINDTGTLDRAAGGIALSNPAYVEDEKSPVDDHLYDKQINHENFGSAETPLPLKM